MPLALIINAIYESHMNVCLLFPSVLRKTAFTSTAIIARFHFATKEVKENGCFECSCTRFCLNELLNERSIHEFLTG